MDTATLYSKLATVPKPIKTWLGSDSVMEQMEKMDEQFTLPAGSSFAVAKLIQKLQIKDITPEYFSGELASELKLDKDKAIHITEEVKKNIFSPIKKDLSDYGINISDLDKFQMPPVKNPPSSGPAIIQDIGPSMPKPPVTQQPKPITVATAQATSQSMSGMPNLKTTAIPNANIPPMAPKVSRLSDVGWSRSQTVAPVVKLDVSQMPKAAPASVQQSRPAVSPQSSAPANHTLGEFERLNAIKRPPNASAPIPAPTPITAPTAAPSAEPAPFILHQDASFAAATKNAGFKISQPQTSADMHLSSTKPPQPTVKPAVLEFAGQANKPPMATPSAVTGSVIHYSQFQSPLSQAPTQNSGPRQVSQIVSPTQPMPTPPAATPNPTASVPVPRPPQPPAASSVPRPPMPPAPTNTNAKSAQPEKVIVKDFL